MRLALAAVATSFLVLPAAEVADAKCAYWGLLPSVLAGPGDAPIAKDGGILVAAVPSERGTLDKGDAAQPPWKFRGRGGLVAATVEALAPGLAVFRPGAGGTLDLEDDKHALVGKAHVDAAATARLGAPKVKTVTYTGESGGRRAWARVTVELDGAIPTGAVAIVAADASGKARSWGRIAAGEPLVAFESRTCQALPNGTAASRPGDKVTLFWVDASGRKSDLSRPIVVGGKVAPGTD
ncbi:MAG: hypothetical protein KIT31_14780 [Deltaproteobacteria bacterium]|nr:hypothetical protein [Deltaproteobacteria bacterium]